MANPNTTQNFPNITAPFVDTESGRINPAWQYLLQSLWARTGEAIGGGVATPGTVQVFAGPIAPDGWLLCDGTAYSQTNFPNLFAAIGTTWGTGGPGTFKVPDARGRFLIGADGTHALGDTGGTLSLTLAQANLPNVSFSATVTDPGHAHGITDPGHAHTDLKATSLATAGVAAGTTTTGGTTGTSTTGITVNSATTGISVSVASGGSGTPLNTTPPFAAMNYIIKS